MGPWSMSWTGASSQSPQKPWPFAIRIIVRSCDAAGAYLYSVAKLILDHEAGGPLYSSSGPATSRIQLSISQTQTASNLPDNLFMARLTAAQAAEFQENGFLLVPNLLDEEETRLLLDAARADRNMLEHAFGVEDTTGRKSKLSLWNNPGDDIFGMVSRSARIVEAMEQLLGGEVYH